MERHTSESFNEFLSLLKVTNNTLGAFCDFTKIKRNVEDISIDLNTLNYLIGKENIEDAIKNIWKRNNEVFRVLPILIAVRDKNKKVIDEEQNVRTLSSYINTLEGTIEFIEESGLKGLFQNKDIKNLVDYVFGVETGLDSNARKNRSGSLMEKTISNIFDKNDISFEREIYSSSLPGLEILGEDEKRFDFVIKTNRKTYLIEVNFYNSGGSKLNEIARSYTDLSPIINSTEKYEFVWITDGKGWRTAKNKLEEAYYRIPHVYNLTTIKEFITLIKSELK